MRVDSNLERLTVICMDCSKEEHWENQKLGSCGKKLVIIKVSPSPGSRFYYFHPINQLGSCSFFPSLPSVSCYPAHFKVNAQNTINFRSTSSTHFNFPNYKQLFFYYQLRFSFNFRYSSQFVRAGHRHPFTPYRNSIEIPYCLWFFGR